MDQQDFPRGVQVLLETYFCPNSAYNILIEDVICKKEGLLRFKDLASVGICRGPHTEVSA
jgi:hypothetical protein